MAAFALPSKAAQSLTPQEYGKYLTRAGNSFTVSGRQIGDLCKHPQPASPTWNAQLKAACNRIAAVSDDIQHIVPPPMFRHAHVLLVSGFKQEKIGALMLPHAFSPRVDPSIGKAAQGHMLTGQKSIYQGIVEIKQVVRQKAAAAQKR